MLLEDHERERFIKYLLSDAESNDTLGDQLDTLNLPGIKKLAEYKKTLAAAERLVANELKNVDKS